MGQFVLFLVGLIGLIAGAKGWIWKEPALKAVIIAFSLILIFLGLFAFELTVSVDEW
ncbi:MAG: hypothetical protein H0Z35_09245 [Thermoanaerobacteraceae bacterium]|nr:hypothetical protein [Thermoanaerobacteraceae bacterium]